MRVTRSDGLVRLRPKLDTDALNAVDALTHLEAGRTGLTAAQAQLAYQVLSAPDGYIPGRTIKKNTRMTLSALVRLGLITPPEKGTYYATPDLIEAVLGEGEATPTSVDGITPRTRARGGWRQPQASEPTQ